MTGTIIGANRAQITLTEAKKVLGTTVKGLSDSAILRLVAQMDVLTDIVVAHIGDSIIKSSIENSCNKSHTEN